MPVILGKEFISGCKDFLPMSLGVLPFGLVTGINGIAQGMSSWDVLLMTVIFYSGSAQLVTFQMIQDNTPYLVIWLTAVVINLRFAIYSATFSKLLSPLKRTYRWIIGYMLSDQAYALCTNSNFTEKDSSEKKVSYLFGAALSMWACWVLSVLAGITLGSDIPSSWSLDFTIPLAFLGMLIFSLKSKTMLIVAASSSFISVLLNGIPYNIGFIVAVTIGVALGMLNIRSKKAE